MFDRNAKLILERLKEYWASMADRLEDFIYTDESKEMIDVVNLLLLGWILLGLIVYIIGNVVASYVRKKKGELSESSGKDLSSFGQDHGETYKATCAKSGTISSESPATDEVVFTKTTISESRSTPKLIVQPTLPVTTGDDPDVVQWVNNLLSWIYVNKNTEPILEAWLSALNKKTRSTESEHGILLEFRKVLDVSKLPVLSNVYATTTDGSRDNITIACHLHVEHMSCLIYITQLKEKEMKSVPYELLIEKLDGKINIDCIPENLTFAVTFLENPLIKFVLRPDSSISLPTADQHVLEDVLMDVITEALAAACVNLNFSHLKHCPRLTLKIPVCETFSARPSFTDDERLLVKVVKATNLTCSKEGQRPYCIVEMDEPTQKFQTVAAEGENPFWDEAFIFSVKDVNAELLFEIYDNSEEGKEKFLGLVIISIEELLRNTNQRQIMYLQSRPLEKDNVTGSLVVEFLFLDKKMKLSDDIHLAQRYGFHDGATQSGKLVETNSRVTAGGTIITTTTIKRAPQEDAGSHGVSSCRDLGYSNEP